MNKQRYIHDQSQEDHFHLCVIERLDKLVSLSQDLVDAITRLNSSTSAELAAIAAKLASMTGQGTVSDADVQVAVDAIKHVADELDAETAALAVPTP